ncbi:hypothetical protein K3U94_06315 [Mycolicibacter heraklionensis]|uniref:Uncharacterized protein n=1 Tax=Mycolicibacter heraklionensis TaxID=512402 RepID=A0A9X7ZHC9_9MYCO|nr:hypothetical protein [Mycolicibacter heraklionensis]QZA08885.1 hypothetical protein K3U94_06315 [Mycolicibacter heraklionensis]
MMKTMLVTCGLLSFAWVLGIGITAVFPAAMPEAFRDICSSQTESSLEFAEGEGIDQAEQNGRPRTPIRSVKMTETCQPPVVPGNYVLAATILTLFFFMAIVVPIVGPIVIKTPWGEYRGARPMTSPLVAQTANAADAGVLEYDAE